VSKWVRWGKRKCFEESYSRIENLEPGDEAFDPRGLADCVCGGIGGTWCWGRDRKKNEGGGEGGEKREPEDQRVKIEIWASSCPSGRLGLSPYPLAVPSPPFPLGSRPPPSFPLPFFSVCLPHNFKWARQSKHKSLCLCPSLCLSCGGRNDKDCTRIKKKRDKKGLKRRRWEKARPPTKLKKKTFKNQKTKAGTE
jgi:hypothetical protein